ncbi:MAG TPA: hypothetical protein VGS05_17345 [Candidatus Sulfotelmatobacter sp.]|nr:hypothetical protein [Candidatus Sulfotelmatobacter sp.]
MNRSEEATIADLASEIQQCLAGPLREKFGYEPQVVLVDDAPNKIRRKRKDASAERWSAERGDQILIRFTPPEPSAAKGTISEPPSTGPSTPGGGKVKDDNATVALIQALNRAEHRRGFDFVSLKWFRDTALPAEPFEWAQSDHSRRQVLADAIEKRLILTNKVPNPRSPFPVTAIRLNHSVPEVINVIGQKDDTDFDFHPVEILGEPLSATVIRERRQ